MPPKSKAVDAKAKAAQAARRDSKKRILENSNCIDEAEGTCLKTSAKKQKTELTIEQDTLKACKDNFKGYSDFQLRHVLNKDNFSVYDQLFQRKTDKILDPKVACGKNFYADLKKRIFWQWITRWIPRRTRRRCSR
jgi:hypothetical protein